VPVVAIDERDCSVAPVERVRRRYPQVRILARAFDVGHLYLLRKAGADLAVREAFEASLETGVAALEALGLGSIPSGCSR
jgi:voltage-gated potassium channel Kch